MHVVEVTDYKPPFYLFNEHLETVIPSLFRKVKGVNYTRERIDTPDNDFLDLDRLYNDSNKLMIVTHGLEGSSNRHYTMGMSKIFHKNGWDTIAWNCRSCSEEINLTPRMYHHGDTSDLAFVVEHALKNGQYEEVVMIGFSMGGSLTLRYLGERHKDIDSRIKKGIVFSVPCDLTSSVDELEKEGRGFYTKRFLKKLGAKIKIKSEQFPEIYSHEGFDKIKDFRGLDNRYTAPLYGYENAADFYLKASCGQFIDRIAVPTLIVNAQNDPFLGDKCYPRNIDNSNVRLEIPKRGGHVGFMLFGSSESWAEKRALDFAR